VKNRCWRTLRSVRIRYQDKIVVSGPYLKQLIFFISAPQSPTYRDLKIIKIEEIKNLTVRQLLVYQKNIGDCVGKQAWLSIDITPDPPLLWLDIGQ
jgi:hypothetical protein